MSGVERKIALIILPVIPVLLWQTFFSLQLSYEILLLGASACGVLDGVGMMSGGEPFFAIAWPAMALGTLVGFAAVLQSPTSRR